MLQIQFDLIYMILALFAAMAVTQNKEAADKLGTALRILLIVFLVFSIFGMIMALMGVRL